MGRYVLILCAVLCIAGVATALEEMFEYPLWDGRESIASYAHRTGLAPEKEIDLGNGVRLEMVLIPAGRFTMGMPQPKEPDAALLYEQQLVGAFFFSAGLGCLLVLAGSTILIAWRTRRRIQVSLARFIVMALVGSITLLGALHGLTYANLESEYHAALYRWHDADLSEQSTQEVLIPRPFYLGKYEVTQAQFETVMKINPSGFMGDALPVDNILWNDAHHFCLLASRGKQRGLRLPLDEEWEYACRAGTLASYHAGQGESSLVRAGWYEKNSSKMTHPVGQKEPNRFGLYDMHGNVSEWCDNSYISAVDLLDNNHTIWYCVRGGSWLDDEVRCRATFRHALNEYTQGRDLGFRVALDVTTSIGQCATLDAGTESQGNTAQRYTVDEP